MPSLSPQQTATLLNTVAATSALLGTLWLYRHRRRRQERTRWVQAELSDEVKEETLPSIIEHFLHFQLDYGTSVDEANKRRTTNYYDKARDAHNYDLVIGVRSYPRLRNRREEEIKRILKYHREGNKSHRTVIVMCDSWTQRILNEARQSILEPLNYSHNIATSNVWIPKLSMVPEEDLHVTVAIPWWWHTIRPGNRQLTEELVARFRQALVVEMHHPFQIELERIILLGGRTLVALWRCIGERVTEDGMIIFDRHGDKPDPFTALRREIVRCFTDDSAYFGQPLTYTHRYPATSEQTSLTQADKKREAFVNGTMMEQSQKLDEEPPPPLAEEIERQNTIELKTPGLGDHDGFIHTTLCRLPLDCLSMKDVELGPIHRLCREATATYCGHRMVVSKFRFLETTGAGGESNPCFHPIFDETIEAPRPVGVTRTGMLQETTDLHAQKVIDNRLTIGALPQSNDTGTIDGLFDEPLLETPKNYDTLN